jgi:hypothetical protein
MVFGGQKDKQEKRRKRKKTNRKTRYEKKKRNTIFNLDFLVLLSLFLLFLFPFFSFLLFILWTSIFHSIFLCDKSYQMENRRRIKRRESKETKEESLIKGRILLVTHCLTFCIINYIPPITYTITNNISWDKPGGRYLIVYRVEVVQALSFVISILICYL